MEKETNKQIDKSLKLIAKSSFVVFFMIAISKVLTYIYRIVVARYYGPEIYGIITLTLVVAGIVVAFALLGIPSGIVRFIPKYRGEKEPKKVKYILKKSISILTITSIISAIILLFLADYIAVEFFRNENLGLFLKIFSLVIPLWVFSNIFYTTLAALEKVGLSSFLSNVALNLVKLVVLAILIFLGVKGEAVVLSYVAGYILLFTLSLFAFTHYTKSFFKEKIDMASRKEVFRKFYSYSWPLILAGVVSQIFFWVDSITIGYFLDVKDVGFYNAAVPIALFLGFAPEILTRLFFPLITREFSQKNIQTTKEASQQVGKWIFMANFPLLIIILSFPEQIITFMFGSEYIVATDSLRILAVGAFILAQANVSRILILISGKSKIILRNIVIASIVSILLNIILIPQIGIVGAALSTAVTHLFLSGLFIKEAKENMSGIIPIRRKVLRVAGVSFVIFIGLNVAKAFVKLNFTSVIAFIIVVLLVYVLLIYFTGCLDKKDVMVLKAIRKSVLRKVATNSA